MFESDKVEEVSENGWKSTDGDLETLFGEETSNL
jgi:hypothetical protein